MKSDHKNFINWYGRNRNHVIQEEIIPCQKAIFQQFSQKFSTDAEKDLARWRVKLYERWNICAQSCNNIHSMLQTSESLYEKFNDIANNIVNMDYESVSDFFIILKEHYKQNNDISHEIDNIIKHLSKMRKISKNHTNIIPQSNN